MPLNDEQMIPPNLEKKLKNAGDHLQRVIANGQGKPPRKHQKVRREKAEVAFSEAEGEIFGQVALSGIPVDKPRGL